MHLMTTILAILRKAPVASLMALVVTGGLLASVALGVHSVGAEAAQRAGTGLRAPTRFLWFLRDRLNSRFGAFTGIAAGWFWMSWDVLGQEPTAEVAIGGDGWMFLRGSGEREDVRGLLPWSASDKAHWLAHLSCWCEVARSRDLPLVVAIAPNKSSMLPDHLQVDEVAPFERTRYGDLLSDREDWPPELQSAMLDLHRVLELCDPELSYFKTDTHWNHHGADCAAEAIADRLGSLGVARKALPRLPMHEETVEGGDLARMLGVATRFSERIAIPDRVRGIRSIEDLQQAPPPQSLPRSPAIPRVLVVHDSFGMILRDPLSARLPGCVYERGAPASMSADQLKGLIDRESPDAIVIIFVERRLTGLP